ncbi:hypothetical protein [Haemophilus influenzae]|uniref:hypothetical protein n=1 Tax=Haemophilus influenzae TaxID=727 RepID=UPI00313AC63E
MLRFICVSAVIFADLFYKITGQDLDIVGYSTLFAYILRYPNLAIKFLLFLLPQYIHKTTAR